MKSKIWKILAVSMAAALIACVGAGCSKDDSKSEESSAVSAASTADTSKSESVTESDAESKTESAEESKSESAEESKTESAEESGSESAEESTDESTEESVEESTEASQENSTSNEGYASFFGSWEYDVGGTYTAVVINSDGSAVYRDSTGNSAPATWTVENGMLCVRAAGGLQRLDYADGTLVDAESGRVYLKVDTLAIDRQTENSSSGDNDGYASFFGSWEYDVGGTYTAVVINSDGSAVYRDNTGNSAPATWTVENGKLCVRAAGGLQRFDIVNDNIVDSDTGRVYLRVDTLAIDR